MKKNIRDFDLSNNSDFIINDDKLELFYTYNWKVSDRTNSNISYFEPFFIIIPSRTACPPIPDGFIQTPSFQNLITKKGLKFYNLNPHF